MLKTKAKTARFLNRLSNLKHVQKHIDEDPGSDEEPEWLKEIHKLPDTPLDSPDNNILFTDRHFPINKALGYDDPKVKWLRPHEICSDPKFFSGGLEKASQFDVVQGELGDCWFLSAVAVVSMRPELLDKVVENLTEQSFDKNHEDPDRRYTGQFNFAFYQYGKWVGVTVDDRLPTKRGKLIFTRSADKTEFWSALLEKAYAKLNGSYNNLKGGLATEAMVDLTGGIVEYFEFKNFKPSRKHYRNIKHGFENGALMSCAIQAFSQSDMEAQRSDGLMIGHAYSITSCQRIKNINTSERYRLLRLRNPWGEIEFNGRFSDLDNENWSQMNKDLRDDDDDNGEFWIEFKDWAEVFTKLEFCRIDMTSDDAKINNIQGKYVEKEFASAWREENAGGCSFLGQQNFFNNPFIVVELDGGEESDQMLISLSQKHRRKLKSEGKSMLQIGFDIYKLVKSYGEVLSEEQITIIERSDNRNYSSNGRNLLENMIDLYKPVYRAEYTKRRDYVKTINNLSGGKYVIIPHTYHPGLQSKFYMRVFIEKSKNDEEDEDENWDYV